MPRDPRPIDWIEDSVPLPFQARSFGFPSICRRGSVRFRPYRSSGYVCGQMGIYGVIVTIRRSIPAPCSRSQDRPDPECDTDQRDERATQDFAIALEGAEMDAL